jgi:hypothetical protein
MGKGLYGQLQGNENRSDKLRFEERLADNAVAEGHHVAVMKRMWEEEEMEPLAAYAAELVRANGFSQARVDSMMRSATAETPAYLKSPRRRR